jgi:hypothetical protein
MSTATAKTGRSTKQASLSLFWPGSGTAVALLLIVIGIVLAGRRDERLPVAYGRRRGAEAAPSVNGTAVLADLYRRHGRRVGSVVRFSPALERYSTIVWVPNDFAPPDEEHRDYLENWLTAAPDRTLVYVGRDYNAAIDYWDRVRQDAPPEQSDEIIRRAAEAHAHHEAARSAMPSQEDTPWFTVARDEPPQHIDNLSGPWAADLDPKQAELHLEGQLTIPASPRDDLKFETLLEANGQPLVFRVTCDTWDNGQIIVIANGSWTLNYPLVNHENRKLAARLIETSSKVDDRVVFVESEADGPPIRDKEKPAGAPNALELLKVWPLNVILLHVAMLGVVLCLARAPIFGRPRDLIADSPADFGKHVAALGKLLAATKDRQYAQTRLGQYRQGADRRPTKAAR